MAFQSFEDLEVWKKACQLAVRIYDLLRECMGSASCRRHDRHEHDGSRQLGFVHCKFYVHGGRCSRWRDDGDSGVLVSHKKMHDVVIVGEILAISAIVMCLLFATVDLGRPERFWHMIPGIGRFNWPMSMLTWDVIVLNGYLLLNLHVCGYLMYMRFLGREPNKSW